MKTTIKELRETIRDVITEAKARKQLIVAQADEKTATARIDVSGLGDDAVSYVAELKRKFAKLPFLKLDGSVLVVKTENNEDIEIVINVAEEVALDMLENLGYEDTRWGQKGLKDFDFGFVASGSKKRGTKDKTSDLSRVNPDSPVGKRLKQNKPWADDQVQESVELNEFGTPTGKLRRPGRNSGNKTQHKIGFIQDENRQLSAWDANRIFPGSVDAWLEVANEISPEFSTDPVVIRRRSAFFQIGDKLRVALERNPQVELAEWRAGAEGNDWFEL